MQSIFTEAGYVCTLALKGIEYGTELFSNLALTEINIFFFYLNHVSTL